jgi:hypothetical protein
MTSTEVLSVYAKACAAAGCRQNKTLTRSFAGMRTPDEITSLDLSINVVGKNGAMAVLHMLPQLRRLQRLLLVDNSIENEHVQVLAEAAANHPSLTEIDLSNNPISHAAGKQLLQLAKVNPRIRAIRLGGSLINPGLIRMIETKCASNDTVEIVDEPSDPIRPATALTTPDPTHQETVEADPRKASETPAKEPSTSVASSTATTTRRSSVSADQQAFAVLHVLAPFDAAAPLRALLASAGIPSRPVSALPCVSALLLAAARHSLTAASPVALRALNAMFSAAAGEAVLAPAPAPAQPGPAPSPEKEERALATVVEGADGTECAGLRCLLEVMAEGEKTGCGLHGNGSPSKEAEAQVNSARPQSRYSLDIVLASSGDDHSALNLLRSVM